MTVFEDIFSIFGDNGAPVALVGIIFAIAVITAIISFILSIITYVLEAIPTFILARKLKRPLAWLSWIPIFSSYFRLYVLADIPGSKPFTAFGGKINLLSRPLSFLIYVGIRLLGKSLITGLISLLMLIPVVGQIASAVSALLYLIPVAAVAIMEYIYLKDVIDVFKEDKKSNSIAAMVVTVLDTLITFGFARVVYLYTLLKTTPLESKDETVIDATVID